LSWTPATDPYNGEYLIEFDPCYPQSGCSRVLYNGNATTPLQLTRTTPGTWQYRVVFGWRASNGQIQVTGQSNQVSVVVPTPVKPDLLSPPRSPLKEGFRLQWTNDPGDFIYQLSEDTRSDFTTPDSPQYWPSSNSENIPAKTPGVYYYRVRSWNKLPQNGGIASAWSNVISVKVLSDEEFLELIERRVFDYFLATTSATGLTLDRLGTDGTANGVASVAAGGFYLSALTVGAEKAWIERTEAYNRAKTALTTYLNGTPTVHGFFYHFLKADGTPSDVPFREVSSIDTALLAAGALQAGEYFGGEVKTLADSIYRRIEWSWMLDPGLNLLHQSWTETNGFQGYYNSYSEAILAYLLAIGSPTYPIPPGTFYSFARPKGSYQGPEFIFTPGGEIFTYQYPHAWFDFRSTRDELGVNWWQNSIEGVRANQRFAADNSAQGYSALLWGLTACDGPDGYKAYGARPSYYLFSDGTVAPTGAGASIALAEDLSLPSLKHLYAVHGDLIWKTYGFVDSFNPARNWVDGYYIGIDQGIMLLMLENRKSQLIWRTFMNNEHAIRALSRAHFSGYFNAEPDVTLDDFEDGNFWTPEAFLGWWESAGTNVYRRAAVTSPVYEGNLAMRVEYTKNGDAWSIMGAHLAASNPKKDFSRHELVTLNVYGACDLLLKLRDQTRAEQDVATLRAKNPNGWNRLIFDYSALGIDKKAVDNLLIFVDPGNGATSGTIFLDQIKLETRKPVVLENFEDASFWTPDTSLGWWDVDGTRVYRRSQSKDPSRGGFGAMKVEYTKDGLAWSFFGGHLSAANPGRDFSRFTRLVVWVYGKADLLVKLRDRALRQAELGTGHATNTNGWTRLVFDFSRATGVDLTDIDNILFFVDPGNPSSSGSISFDDIALE
jgi:hypothetical protein